MEAGRTALTAAAAAARAGDSTGARNHYEAAIAATSSEAERLSRVGENNAEVLTLQCQAQLALAELLWQTGDKPAALQSYEGARDSACKSGNIEQESMISLGMGYALLNSGDDSDLPAAIAAMKRSKQLAQDQGHKAQVDFVESLISQAQARQPENVHAASSSGTAQNGNQQDEEAALLQSFVRSLTSRNPVMLFIKGSTMKPECGFSLSSARTLMSLEVDFGEVDVGADSKLREAIKTYSDWPTFPQLWVGGELLGGADIIEEMAANNELLKAIEDQLLRTEGNEIPADSIRGTRVPRKVWPAISEQKLAQPQYRDTESTGCCSRSARWKLALEENPGGHWQVLIASPEQAETATCRHSHASESDRCVHNDHVHAHGVDETVLSEEARAWMAQHPDEKLPIHLCPTHGDCGTCPERKHCKWHSKPDEPTPDIEDLMISERRRSEEKSR